MEVTYFDRIKEVIKNNTYIHNHIVSDVLNRCNDWLDHSNASKNDQYIKRQYIYLLGFVKLKQEVLL